MKTKELIKGSHPGALYNAFLYVFLLMVAMEQNFSADLYFMTGNQNQSKIISLKKVCDEVGSEICNSIIGFHAFTGCDFVSSFYGKGKRKAWKVLSDNTKSKEAFESLETKLILLMKRMKWSFSDECLPPTEGAHPTTESPSVYLETFTGRFYCTTKFRRKWLGTER